MELLGRQRRRASSSTCNPRSRSRSDDEGVPEVRRGGETQRSASRTSRDSNCSMCPFRMRCSPRSHWRNHRLSGSTPGSPLRRNSLYTCRPRCPRWWYLARNRSRRGCRNAWCTCRHPDSTLLAGHRSSPHLLCTPIRQCPLPTYCNRPAAAGTTNTDRRSTIHSKGSHFFSFSSFPLFWVNGTIKRSLPSRWIQQDQVQEDKNTNSWTWQGSASSVPGSACPSRKLVLSGSPQSPARRSSKKFLEALGSSG